MFGLTVRHLRILTCRVKLAANTLTLSILGGTTQTIESRQFVEVITSGRLLRSVTVLYHPLMSDGLVALDTICNLTIPEVVEMEQLTAELQAWVPT